MRDELEFNISQYVDGVLPPLEAAALEERLARDPVARGKLEEYQALNAALKSNLRAPDVPWDRLESHLSAAVAREDAPVRHYSLVAWRRAAGLAMAACLAIVAAIGFYALRTDPQQLAVNTEEAERPAPVIMVIGPQPQRPAGTDAIAEVRIGPAPATPDSWRYAETIVARPAVVMIDRGSRPAHDTDSMLY